MKMKASDYYNMPHQCRQCAEKDKEIELLRLQLKLTEMRLNKELGMDDATWVRVYGTSGVGNG